MLFRASPPPIRQFNRHIALHSLPTEETLSMRLVYIATAALVASCTCTDAFPTAADPKAGFELDVARVDGATNDHVDEADRERLTKAAEAQEDPTAIRPEDEARNVGGGMKNLLVKGVDNTAG